MSCTGEDENRRPEKIRQQLLDTFRETRTVRELSPVLWCKDSENGDVGEPSKSHRSKPSEVFRVHPKSINFNNLSMDEIIRDKDAPGPYHVWKDKEGVNSGDKLKENPKTTEVRDQVTPSKDSHCRETKEKDQDLPKEHKFTNPMKDSERRTIWGSGPAKVGGAESK